MTLLTFSFIAACSGDDEGENGNAGGGGEGGGDATTPTVVSNAPLDGVTGVAINVSASATFSEPMDPASLTPTTFSVTTGTPAVAIAGSILYSGTEAVFWPAVYLASDQRVTATITTGALSLAGVALAEDYSWSFTTGDTLADTLAVNLGTAGDFAILAKSGIATVPESAITGDLGISPAAASFITGFSLAADATNTFSTSTQVVGKIYAADDAPPTPSKMTTAISDMEIAFTDAAARAPGVTELGAGDIGGETLPAGVYKWGTGLLIPTDVTLAGSPTDVWIFQIAQDLTVSSGVRIVLAGGALPENIFWQVSGLVELDTTSHLEGVVLSQTSVTLRTGATLNGRILAQTAVNIDGSTIVEPAE